MCRPARIRRGRSSRSWIQEVSAAEPQSRMSSAPPSRSSIACCSVASSLIGAVVVEPEVAVGVDQPRHDPPLRDGLGARLDLVGDGPVHDVQVARLPVGKHRPPESLCSHGRGRYYRAPGGFRSASSDRATLPSCAIGGCSIEHRVARAARLLDHHEQPSPRARSSDRRLSDLGLELRPSTSWCSATGTTSVTRCSVSTWPAHSGLTPDDVLVTPGAASALFCTATALLEPGDHSRRRTHQLRHEPRDPAGDRRGPRHHRPALRATAGPSTSRRYRRRDAARRTPAAQRHRARTTRPARCSARRRCVRSWTIRPSAGARTARGRDVRSTSTHGGPLPVAATLGRRA